MKRRNTLVGLAVVVAALGLWLFSRDSDRGGTQSEPTAPVSRSTQRELQPPAQETQELASTERSEVAPGDAAPFTALVPDPEPTTAIRGRCFSELGQPLEDVSVSLKLFPRNQPGDLTAADLIQFPVQNTDDDGTFRFELEVLLDQNDQFWIEASKVGSCNRLLTTGAGTDTRDIDLGDITMYVGSLLTGMVLDQFGEPVPEVFLSLRAASLIGDEELGSMGNNYVNMRGAHTDAEGQFSTGASVRAGQWEIRSMRQGVVSWVPRQIEVLVGEQTDVLVRCVRAQPIDGTVSTVNGPVEGVLVTAMNANTKTAATLGRRTDKLGRFRLVRGVGASEEVLVLLERTRAYSCEPVPARWGDGDVQLTATAAPVTRIHIESPGGLSPLTKAWVCAHETRENLLFREHTCVEPGVLELNLPEDRDTWLRIAAGPASSVQAPERVAAGAREVWVELQAPSTARSVRVVDAAGDAVVAAIVKSIMSRKGDELQDSTANVPSCFGSALFFLSSSKNWAWELGKTDDKGQAAVHVTGLDHWVSQWLVTCDGFVPVLHPDSTDEEMITIILQSATEASCELTGSWPHVWLTASNVDGRSARYTSQSTVGGGARSRFKLDGLEPGLWTLTAHTSIGQCELGEVGVRADVPNEFEFAVSHYVYPEQNVLIDGLPTGIDDGFMWTFARGLAGGPGKYRRPLDVRNGSVTLPALLRGDYDVQVGVSSDPDVDEERLKGVIETSGVAFERVRLTGPAK